MIQVLFVFFFVFSDGWSMGSSDFKNGVVMEI